MFSRNVEKLLVHLVRDGAFALDDDIARAMLVCRGGEVTHPQVVAALAAVQKELAA
jgi:hypothetical protein